jgi:hypothetical protein
MEHKEYSGGICVYLVPEITVYKNDAKLAACNSITALVMMITVNKISLTSQKYQSRLQCCH